MFEHDKKPVVIIAYQRSGTTALRRILEKEIKFYNYGEVFASQRTVKDGGVYHYLKMAASKDINILEASFKKRVEFFDSYFGYLKSLNDARILIDVKYDVLYNLNTYYFNEDKAPFFLQYLKMRRFKVIHLIRDNTLELVLSYEIAKQKQFYHQTKPLGDSSIDIQKINVDPDEIIKKIKYVSRQQSLQKGFLRDCDTLELKYEDIFHNNQLTASAQEAMKKHLNIKFTNKHRSDFIKVSKSNLLLIDNSEELIEALADNKLDYMINV